MKSGRQSGFTLIELVIVMAIVAILAAVAFPAYQEQVRKSNRAAAQSEMMDIANRQQQFFLANRSYADSLDGLSYALPDEVSERYEIETQIAAWHESKKPRPRALTGSTFRVETPLGKAFITVNENGGQQPFEVFINTAKAGSETAAVSEAIRRAVRRLVGERPGLLAVRSSAPDEDSAAGSFAGLHESVLEVAGEEAVLDAVRIVRASLWSDAAILYRRELKLDPAHSRMAVVVQEMVAGDPSGVAFGRDPRDTGAGRSVIEANRLMLGSDAELVVRAASSPVLLVQPSKKARRAGKKK